MYEVIAELQDPRLIILLPLPVFPKNFTNQSSDKQDLGYCGLLYFRGYQFSWIEYKSNIRGVQKFVVIVFSFIIHTENHYFVGTEIRGWDPPRKLIPHEN